MKVRHRLAAVWFADIVDYSRLSAADESHAVRLVGVFQSAARGAVERFGGRIVKFLGDGALAEFDSVQSAIAAADCLAELFDQRARASGIEPATLRIGVHTGEVVEAEDGDVYGDGVNVAARICAEAAAGEIVLSEDAWRQARRHQQIETEPLGPRELKGIGSVELYRARLGSAIEPEERPVRRGFRDRVGTRTLALAAIIGAVAIGWLLARTRIAPDAPAGQAEVGALDPSRLAVLYFEDRTPGAQDAHLAHGFTEAIIHQVSGIEPLDVVSRHGVAPYADSDVPLDSVARALGAGILLDGSVTRVGDRVRVSAQLIDGEDLSAIVSWTEERPWGELFELQEDVSATITDALRRRLGERLRREARREGTRSVEAWDQVQRAERLVDRAYDVDDGTVARTLRSQADSLLARAQALDPRWIEPPLARAALAARRGGPEAYHSGLEHVSQALSLSPNDPRALAARGVLYDSLASAATDSVEAARFLVAAQRDLQAAVAGDPRLASAWIALADLLYNDLWQLAEARRAAHQAYEQDVFLLEEGHYVWLCEISLQLEDPAEAERWCREGRRRFPERERLMMTELVRLASTGTAPEPAVAWQLVAELSRRDYPEYNVPPAKVVTAAVLARAGMGDSARAVVADARLAAPAEVIPFLDYLEAYVRLELGERERSISLLRSFLQAAPSYRAFVARDPWFDPLRGDRQFESIVDRRRLPIFCRLLCRPPP